jgi:hypothetical protein
MSIFKNTLLAGLAGIFAATGAAGVAQAVPLDGTFNITVFQGSGGGVSTDPRNQANTANPLPEIGSGTYTGNLDFTASINTIGSFLASGGGTESAGLLLLAGDTLSTAGYGLTTMFEITPASANNSTGSGTILHDDGIGLYNPGPTLITPLAAEGPTAAELTAYSGLAASGWELFYVEANGLPATLDFEVATTPLPAAVWLFGGVLGGAAFLTRRRRRDGGQALSVAV